MTAHHSHWAGCYTLWWVSSALFVKMPFLGRDTKCLLFQCTFLRLSTAPPSVSVTLVMLGFVGNGWVMETFPVGDFFLGEVPSQGVQEAGETPHALCVLHPEPSEGTKHFLQSGVRQFMLWRENGAKILLIESCKGLFLMQNQRYTLWLRIPVVEWCLPGRNIWGGCSGNSEPREECLSVMYQYHSLQVSIPNNVIW